MYPSPKKMMHELRVSISILHKPYNMTRKCNKLAIARWYDDQLLPACHPPQGIPIYIYKEGGVSVGKLCMVPKCNTNMPQNVYMFNDTISNIFSCFFSTHYLSCIFNSLIPVSF